MTHEDPHALRAMLARLMDLSDEGHGDGWAWLMRRLPEPVVRGLGAAFFEWRAHGGQAEPEGDWRTWLLMAGRGFGKTRAGAEWVSALARAHPGCRIALVAASRDEAVKVMVEGPSGLLAVAHADEDMVWWPTRGVVIFASGAEAFVYSAAAPESLRGPEHHFAWCDELAKWPAARTGESRAEAAWDNLNMGLRLGDWPRVLVTTTPRTGTLLRRVKAAPGTVESFGRTRENAHLAEGVRAWLEETYGGTRLGRQELHGVLFDAPAGALFPRELIEGCLVPALLPGTGRDGQVAMSPGHGFGSRGDPNLLIATRSGVVEGAAHPSQGPLHHAAHGPPPRTGEELRRIVVGVDPPVSAEGDACGIVVCGQDRALRLYVLADASVSGLSPEGWARAVARSAEAWGADRVVAEKNQGGEMVASVLRSADVALPVKLVSARRGKAARAEPVATRFEAGAAFFAGRFPELEDELAGLILGGGYEPGGLAGRSPDRADACVWAMTELLRSPARPAVRGF